MFTECRPVGAARRNLVVMAAQSQTWPASLAGAQTATDAVVALAADEVVHINVLDPEHRLAVVERFSGRVPPGNVLTHLIPTDDAWCRDHGAIFVIDERGERVALNFRFNAWGGKYPFERDNAVPAQMAAVVGAPVTTVDVVLEGGSIDVNGAGVVLTTEQCLLNPNRNPTLQRADIEAALCRYLLSRRYSGSVTASSATHGQARRRGLSRRRASLRWSSRIKMMPITPHSPTTSNA
jgi:agmatine/peptidylarginine deiminase